MIYWMIVFEHRQCFGMYRVRIGVPGVTGPPPPGKLLGLMGLVVEERRPALGAPQVGGDPLGLLVGFGPPSFYQREKGGRRRKGGLRPLP